MSIEGRSIEEQEQAKDRILDVIPTVPRMRSIKQAAEETGLPEYCVRKLCLSEKIVYIRTGVKYMINLDKLIEYLNRGDNTQ